MNTNTKAKYKPVVHAQMFNIMVKPFSPDVTYFGRTSPRDGLSRKQLKSRHSLNDNQCTRLSYTLNYWLDIVDSSQCFSAVIKRRLYDCTFRFGSRPTSGFRCKLRKICPWCRTALIQELLNIPIKSEYGLVIRVGNPDEKKRVFRTPRDTIHSLRCAGLGAADKIVLCGIFLKKTGKWNSIRSFSKLISDIFTFNPDLITNADLYTEYSGVVTRVQMHTITK